LTRPLVWRLPDPEFLDQIRRRYDPPQDAWRVPELLELLLPIMRADMGVCDTYVYGDEPPFDFPIVACGGVDDREAPIEELDAWREQTNSTISLHAFPGGHFYINRVLPKLRSLLAAEMASFAAGEGRGGGPAIT
jgi:medium-chain acyl-[acyl-carrier-protein] hydrolase